MIKELLLSRRAVVEMKLQRKALERIATCLEEFLLQQKGKGFRSLYNGTADGEVLNQTDEDFAELEEMEREKAKAGGDVGFDDDFGGER